MPRRLCVPTDHTSGSHGDKVTYTGNAGNLTGNGTYWAIRASDTTFRLVSSVDNARAGTAVDIASAGSGSHGVQRAGVTVADISTVFDTVTVGNHSLQTGDKLRYEAATPIGGLVSGRDYYVIKISDDRFQLAPRSPSPAASACWPRRAPTTTST